MFSIKNSTLYRERGSGGKFKPKEETKPVATSTPRIVLKKCTIKSIETISKAPTVKEKENNQSQASIQKKKDSKEKQNVKDTTEIPSSEIKNFNNEQTKMAGKAAKKSTSNLDQSIDNNEASQQKDTSALIEGMNEALTEQNNNKTSIEEVIEKNLSLIGITTENKIQEIIQAEDDIMNEITIQAMLASNKSNSTEENTTQPSVSDSIMSSIAGGGITEGAAGEDRMQSSETGDIEEDTAQQNQECAESMQEDQ